MLQKIERSLVTIGEIISLNNQLRDLGAQIDTCRYLQKQALTEIGVVTAKLSHASKALVEATKENEVRRRRMLEEQQLHLDRCIEKHSEICSEKQNLQIQYDESNDKFKQLNRQFFNEERKLRKAIEISVDEGGDEGYSNEKEEFVSTALMASSVMAKGVVHGITVDPSASEKGISVDNGGAEGFSSEKEEFVATCKEELESTSKQLAALTKQLSSTSNTCSAALQEEVASCKELAVMDKLFVSGIEEVDVFWRKWKDLQGEFDQCNAKFKSSNYHMWHLCKQRDQSSHKLNELKHSLMDCEILGVESREALEVVVNLRKEKIWEGQISVMNAPQSEELFIVQTSTAQRIPINNDYTAGKGCQRKLDQLGPPAPD